MAVKYHVNITDPYIHEPKDISYATSAQVYVSDGSGSGTWTDTTSLAVDAFSGNDGAENSVYLSDGAESGAWGTITADIIDSDSATENQVLLADGLGGASFGSITDIVSPCIETIIDTYSAASTQNPTATDTALQIEFGSAVNDDSDEAMLSAAGALTINEDGCYLVNVNLEVGRSGGQGESHIYVRALKNGSQLSPGYFAKLDDEDVTAPYSRYRWMDLDDGDVLTWEVIRDSAGNNSGGLIQSTPTLTTWETVPTARIVVQKLQPTS